MKLKFISIFLFFLVQVKGYGQEVVLQDDFNDRSHFIDLSELLFWYNADDTLSAFELKEIQDANALQFKALTLKPEAIGEGGYNAGSSYASTCIDYQLPLFNRHQDTLIIEFDYLSLTLSGSGESGRLGIATMYQYPTGGPEFNDVYNQEKSHPFGRPAYNLRILNKANDGNGAYLFYGGGVDELGEFELTGDGIWLPGFISGPGGFSPGQKENYPLAPVLEATQTLVSDRIWQHYTWMITPDHLLVYSRASNETPDKNVLQMDLLLPDGNEDEVVQKLNNFYKTSIDKLPENYHYFERIEALRFYFRSVDNGYLANVKVSKTSHFEPALLAFANDTLLWQWEMQNDLQIPVSILNPNNLEASLQLKIVNENSIIAGEEFSFELSSMGEYINLPFNESYAPAEKTDTLIISIQSTAGWLNIQTGKLWVLIEDGRVTAFQQEYVKPAFYPNPFVSDVHSALNQPVAYQIYNAQQKLVKEGVMKKVLRLEQLSPGIYFMKYQHGQKSGMIKLIKK